MTRPTQKLPSDALSAALGCAGEAAPVPLPVPLIDPADPPEQQIARQAKIIDALVRRANRQHEVGGTAYGNFLSAIALQAQVWDKTRDLERTASELASVRSDRERTRKNLTDALSAMEGGFALFTDGVLEVSNDLFRGLLPDISAQVLPGLGLDDYARALLSSQHLVSADGRLRPLLAQAMHAPVGRSAFSLVIETRDDLWFQLTVQRTSLENIVLLVTDITRIVRQNRSEKENLIDRQAHYLQAVFQNMTSGLCTFAPDGAVRMHNAQFRQLLGLPYMLLQKGVELQLLLDHLGQVVATDWPAPLEATHWIGRLRRRGKLRNRLRLLSGRVLDMHAHMLPDGGFLVDLSDVSLEVRANEILENRVAARTEALTRANASLTEQYQQKARVEEELRLAKERAEAAVSSKTRFLAAASHDLLQPINAAKLMIATLRETSEGTMLFPMVDRLQGSFTSIEQLLHALLDISRLEATDASALSPTEVCLGTLMQSVFEDQTEVARQKGVRLRMVPNMVFVRSDPVYLLRSIQNLVVNALQYTPPGGQVLFGTRRRGGRIVLEVWDTGIGISLKDQKRIFEEFTRADNVPLGSGVGLGLSIVDRTCRHLGHAVAVRSKPGMGSVFSIGMEMVAGQPRPVDEGVPAVSGESADMDLIVLCVENDPAVLFAMISKLEQWGASVLGATSTAEALAHVRDIGMPPDIILADYQLDNADTGTDTIRQVRALTGVEVPAIMITADRGDHLMRMGAEENFAVLTKPVRLRKLRPLIEWKTRSVQVPDLAPDAEGDAWPPGDG